MSYLAKLEAIDERARWASFRQWMIEDPFGLYKELREFRPVLEFPEAVVVTTFDECTRVLREHQTFSTKLYQRSQGAYWMSQDDTPRHWREKSMMKALLDLESVPEMARQAGESARRRLSEAGGTIDLAKELSRVVPVEIVQKCFGFDRSDPGALIEWSFWSQQDTFHNQSFDSVVVSDPDHITRMREQTRPLLAAYLGDLVRRRAEDLANGNDRGDPTSRLLKIAGTGAIQITPELVALNVGGLLIGTVETISHATINAIEELLVRRTELARALAGDRRDFGGYVWEALRFNPAFPYFFRVCEKDVLLGAGTDYQQEVPVGKTVVAITHAAMFDERVISNPTDFDSNRPSESMFTFGHGLHECLGRHIGGPIVEELVFRVLSLPNVRELSPVLYGDTRVPMSYTLGWDTG